MYTVLGSSLLKLVLDECMSHPEWHSVYLNVQTSNEDAINFYEKFGFQNTGTIENYYKRVDPPHCHVLTKVLKHEEGAVAAGSK